MVPFGFLVGAILAAVALKLFLVLTTGRCKSRVCLNGKTAIVTGGNSGIGLETVLALASRGCRVIIADKDDTTETTRRVVERTHNDNIVGRHLDLTSFKSVRKFAEDIAKTEDRLDILINNAGVGTRPNIHTGDGLEMVMQTNYLGHFLLTHLLADLLKKSAPSRIIYTSSLAAFVPSSLTVEKLTSPKDQHYGVVESGMCYNNSKKCCAIASNEFAKRLGAYGVTCNSLNPGVVATQIYKRIAVASDYGSFYQFLISVLFVFAKSPEEGAQTTVELAVSNKWRGVTGKHFWDCRPFPQPPITWHKRLCEDIWRRSEEMCGLKPEEKLKSY